MSIARISRRLMRFWDRDLTVPNAFFDCCFTAVTRLEPPWPVAYATATPPPLWLCQSGGGYATATAALSLIVVPFAPKVYTRPTGKAYISFQTLCSPMFNEYRDLFYSNGVKTVPPTIGDILTARSLAYFLGGRR